MTFTTLSSYLAGIYIADKRTKAIGITTTIAATINLGIDLILIPSIGMWAASLSTLVGYLFLFIYRIIDLRKYHKLTIDTLKADLKEKKASLKAIDKEIVKLEAKKAKADAKAAEEAKKTEAESVLKKLFAEGMSADEILAKLK